MARSTKTSAAKACSAGLVESGRSHNQRHEVDATIALPTHIQGAPGSSRRTLSFGMSDPQSAADSALRPARRGASRSRASLLTDRREMLGQVVVRDFGQILL